MIFRLRDLFRPEYFLKGKLSYHGMEAKESLEYLIKMNDQNPYVMRMTESVITKFKACPRIS